MKKVGFCVALAILCLCCFSFPAQAAVKAVRGVWVSSVYNLDYPFSGTTSENTLKKEADDILSQCVEMGMNTVYLQVRPSADALYASGIFPWSKYLTGRQGAAPENGFDPLAYWVTAAHSRGIKLHAWLNPYRVAMSTADYNSLSASNPAKLHPAWVYEFNGKYYFDAGIPDVRQMVVDGAKEILAGYDVDGIHLDDYFYPGNGSYDDATFAAYSRGFSDKGDWRRNNNDLLIQSLHQTAASYGKVFGVSPAGIWANKSSNRLGSDTKGNQTYYSAYADTRGWVKKGWLDYICPQIYWQIGYAIADYQTLAYWWADVVRGTGVELYIGMADYRYPSTASSGWSDMNIMRQQLALNAAIPEIKGEIHFRFGSTMDYPLLKSLYVSVYSGGEAPLARLISPSAQHTAYLEGDKGSFYPEDGLTRGEIATIFSRLLVDEGGNPLFDPSQSYGQGFSDVHAGDWYAKAVGFMRRQGLLAGYNDGTFRPNAKITRAECATIITRFFLLDSEKTASFRDVSSSYWGYLAIANCYAKGYLSGYPNGTFAPDSSITRGEAAVLVNRVLGRAADEAYFNSDSGLNPYQDLTKAHWAYYDILEASVTHSAH